MIDKSGARTYLRATARRSASFIVLAAAISLVLGLAGQSYAGAVQEANAGRGGQPIDLKSLPVKGKITVVDFFSQYCPPCMQLAPLLEQLAQKRSDLAIKKVNIQRPEFSGGIDFRSPLGQQLGLRSIPHFMIFDKGGKLTVEGKEAYKQVLGWLQEAGLIGKGTR
ncbi:MAG: thioredoxin family protein [Deltaproteobacteria bacterium]|nr:thioredoxin family protein [Deltaproteobacteria bacterium]